MATPRPGRAQQSTVKVGALIPAPCRMVEKTAPLLPLCREAGIVTTQGLAVGTPRHCPAGPEGPDPARKAAPSARGESALAVADPGRAEQGAGPTWGLGSAGAGPLRALVFWDNQPAPGPLPPPSPQGCNPWDTRRRTVPG